jgi:hypothetical protein
MPRPIARVVTTPAIPLMEIEMNFRDRPPDPAKRIGPWQGADSRNDMHGLDGPLISRRRRQFNYKLHPVAAELIRESLRACGGQVRP